MLQETEDTLIATILLLQTCVLLSQKAHNLPVRTYETVPTNEFVLDRVSTSVGTSNKENLGEIYTEYIYFLNS